MPSLIDSEQRAYLHQALNFARKGFMMRSLTFVFAAFAAFSTHLVSACTNTTNLGSPLLEIGNDPPQPPLMLGYVINHFALVVSTFISIVTSSASGHTICQGSDSCTLGTQPVSSVTPCFS